MASSLQSERQTSKGLMPHIISRAYLNRAELMLPGGANHVEGVRCASAERPDRVECGVSVPEVAKEQGGFAFSVPMGLRGRPHSALAQLERAPVNDEGQWYDAQPKGCPPDP